ncbi:MAG TPA: dockerin type I domain-containing protein, partial [Chloroflexota bacterium]|nr:dockerin type I domain-containing protein [Chloroflexota bacterium]HZU05892.1 dockerin type I domain-containing protein [Chloroflexota bacterium]
EIGEFDCKASYIEQVMSWLDGRGQSYLAWTWGPFSCARDPALIVDWGGTPTQTYGQGYKEHLAKVAGGQPTSVPTPTVAATPTLTPLLCDINGDGRVDIFDYTLLVQNFGRVGAGNPADCNRDGRVDIFDYTLLIQNFGRRAP